MNSVNRAIRVIAAASLVLAAGAASAQTYPTRPVRAILPFAAGGLADITTRIVADKLGEKLGQRIIVDNQPGAGGIAAARAVLAAPPDGYTLAVVTNGTAISVPLFKTLPFDPVTDFMPISEMGSFDLALAVNAVSSYRTLGDFLKDAKGNPGKLNVGTISVGSTQNLGAELLRSMSGADFTLVTYRTAPEALIALFRNDIQLLVEYYATVKPGLDDRKVRVLATSGEKRSRMLPNVPTVSEAGVPGYVVTSWNALFAPRGTPPEVIAKLNEAVRQTIAQPDIAKRLLDLGIEAQSGPPEAIEARLKADIAKWTKVIEDAHIPKL
ncbi:MAG: tripartite tricarboxylate transporter substrate binding protein [Xanthobacteraceae bacterium]|nr:tripartite tricarboxylate transporter substrate binding protein [Xanthobacteraceae bacterium]